MTAEDRGSVTEPPWLGRVARFVRRHRPRWGVLSEDGTVYGVGRWRDGRKRHDGAFWLAIRERALLRRAGESHAKLVRR